MKRSLFSIDVINSSIFTKKNFPSSKVKLEKRFRFVNLRDNKLLSYLIPFFRMEISSAAGLNSNFKTFHLFLLTIKAV